MLRKSGKRFYVPVLVLAFLSTSVEITRAQSLTIADTTIKKASLDAEAQLAASIQRRTRYGRPCDPKRRVLTGAAIGFVAGMVVINWIAADHDTSVGVKGTLGGGAYGAAMGAYVGLMTCR